MDEHHPFHRLLPPEAPVLRRRAMTLTGNSDRAADLVQETFLKAWANRDQYKPDTQLRAWLFTILRNAFLSGLRKHKREVEDVDGSLSDLLFEEARQDHAVALNQIITAISTLPEGQRRPLILMGALGFSQMEAAEACRCTVGTMKSRVSRARTNLSQTFGLEFGSSRA